MLCCVWLHSLTVSLRSIHVLHVSVNFLFYCCVVFHCRNIPFICFLVNEHLSYFQLGYIMKTFLMNILVQVGMFSFLLSKYRGLVLWDHGVPLCFVL